MEGAIKTVLNEANINRGKRFIVSLSRAKRHRAQYSYELQKCYALSLASQLYLKRG